MIALKHKVFEIDPRKSFFWSLGGALREFENVRRLAEDFAGEVGAENVVSLVEHLQPRFTVVVWYREEQGAKAARTDEFFEAPTYR